MWTNKGNSILKKTRPHWVRHARAFIHTGICDQPQLLQVLLASSVTRPCGANSLLGAVGVRTSKGTVCNERTFVYTNLCSCDFAGREVD